MNHALQQAMMQAGETAESLAARVGVDPKTAGRWVSPGRTPRPRCRAAVAAILEREVADLWPSAVRGEPDWLRDWVDWEREATAIRWYEPAYVPGILQTEAYARATLADGLLLPDEIEQRVHSRLKRQEILDRDDPPLLLAVLDVMVLRRPVHGHPGVMREQVEHLARMAELPYVQILVVPEDAGIYPGLQGGFILATLRDGSSVAHLDHQVDAQVVSTPDRIATLQRVWEIIRGEALSRRQSLDLIKEAAQTWT
ncbi:DUF5753 domain-containing protein [Verrucosispora sp. TAA-831]|uniref:DUF5753 domain-containing protein n=1 Tax=Verrucosispora sp. TAA-831 TaxID=3422227 RepID=UPI003D6EB70F